MALVCNLPKGLQQKSPYECIGLILNYINQLFTDFISRPRTYINIVQPHITVGV